MTGRQVEPRLRCGLLLLGGLLAFEPERRWVQIWHVGVKDRLDLEATDGLLQLMDRMETHLREEVTARYLLLEFRFSGC